MTEIVVGSLWKHEDGDIGDVIAVRNGRVFILWQRDEVCCDYAMEEFPEEWGISPHVPPAPEPPLTGEQMAYVLEALAERLLSSADFAFDQSGITVRRAVLAVAKVANDAAKDFRK